MKVRHDIETGLAYACKALAARMTELKRDPELDAALALAVLALLKSTEITTDVRNEEEPRIINFERAKAEILARRAQGAVTAQKERRQEPSRPRLRVFYGE